MMSRYKLNKRFATYGIILSYIFGVYYMEMGIPEQYAVVLSTSSLIFCVIGIFGIIGNYPYRSKNY
jgi:hypothetical protein